MSCPGAPVYLMLAPAALSKERFCTLTHPKAPMYSFFLTNNNAVFLSYYGATQNFNNKIIRNLDLLACLLSSMGSALWRHVSSSPSTRYTNVYKKKVALRVRLLLLGLLPLVFTGTRPDGCSSGERSALVKRTRQNVKLSVRSTLR